MASVELGAATSAAVVAFLESHSFRMNISTVFTRVSFSSVWNIGGFADKSVFTVVAA